MKKIFRDSNLKKWLKDAKLAIKKFTNIKEDGLNRLAEYGWYLNGSISLGYTTDLMQNAIDGNVEFLNVFFIDYYKEYLNRLEQGLNVEKDKKNI